MDVVTVGTRESLAEKFFVLILYKRIEWARAHSTHCLHAVCLCTVQCIYDDCDADVTTDEWIKNPSFVLCAIDICSLCTESTLGRIVTAKQVCDDVFSCLLLADGLLLSLEMWIADMDNHYCQHFVYLHKYETIVRLARSYSEKIERTREWDRDSSMEPKCFESQLLQWDDIQRRNPKVRFSNTGYITYS